MKKIVWIAIIATIATLAVVSLSSFSVPSLDDKFEEAGEAAIAEREVTLIQMKEEIESFVWQAVEDRIITRNEMLTLKNLVDNFDETKSRFNRELALYKKETSVTLDRDYQKAISSYFFGRILFKADRQDEAARRLFVTRTGQDVRVEAGPLLEGLGIVMVKIIAICFSIFILSFLPFFKKKLRNMDPLYWVRTISGATWITVLIMLFVS